ncbi:MAG: phosphatidate cytidylyltransferase [Kiritimatiellae bacterium]|nr:phosphatidate cytidylyltransferase [Kiritimatiellia bacterium]MDW8457944.1 CDP-archaeol synthase [Verrucomicrobiota bacterium]
MLRQRLISGLILAAALLAAVFFVPPSGVPFVVLPIVYLALREFYALLDARETPHFKMVGILSGLGLVGATWAAYYFRCPHADAVEPVMLFAACASILLRQLFHTRTNRPWDSIAGTLLGVLYVAFLFNFIAKLLVLWGDTVGRMLVLFLVVVVKCTDIGAYFIGCAIGRHKLFPRISPAKTWEGVVGGVAVGMVAGWAFSAVAGEASVLQGPAVWGVGFLLAVAGVFGDLIESLFKRASGVKDSGTMIQGMGGILDVLDSLLFSAPVMYIAALFFVPPP